MNGSPKVGGSRCTQRTHARRTTSATPTTAHSGFGTPRSRSPTRIRCVVTAIWATLQSATLRRGGRMLLTEIDHVAIAVRDLEAAIDFYRDTFGCEVEHREVVERDGVEEALLKVADSYIQLLTPSRPDSTVAKYLDTKGEGIHHIGYRVDDCAKALAAVKAGGHRVIDEEPRPGSRGTTVAFVHPKTAFGTLIELVQE